MIFFNPTLGMSYPDITNKALCEFTTAATENKGMEKVSVLVRRPQKRCKNVNSIYINGMVPHYTGHVPGMYYKQCRI